MINTLTFRSLAAGVALLISLPACTTAPAPSAALSVEQVHAQALVLDAHADIALPETSPLYLGADGQSKVATDKLRAGGMDAVVMALATGPKPRTPEGRAQGAAEIAAKLGAIQARVAADPDRLTFARTAADVRAAQAQGKTAIILGFQNALALERDVSRLDTLYADGVRVFGLTHGPQ